MDVDEARAAALRLLQEKGRVTNSEILDVCGVEKQLRERVREELIIDELARDKDGAGLVSVAPAAPEPEKVVPAGAADAMALATDVFFSYSHQNWREADEAVRWLRSLGLSVWRDDRIGAAQWPEKISRAIRTCTAFAVLCSEYSLASDDVKNECVLANHHKRYRVPLHLRRPPLEYPEGLDYLLQAWNAIVVAGRPAHEWLDEVITGLEEDQRDEVRRLGTRARDALKDLTPPGPPSLPTAPPRKQLPPRPRDTPPWRGVFRVYISGTHGDFEAERNALHEVVFPRLRRLAMERGADFRAIDLRWGASAEQVLDQRVTGIVHEEIARCQRESPYLNFISLIGDRYGWRPLPELIPADEFKLIRAVVPSLDRELLETWYRRDDNAVPPVYELARRTGPWVDWEAWAPVEDQLRMVIAKAVAGLPIDATDRRKYETSLLEQEVARGALAVEDAREHVFCFFRNITNLDELVADVSAEPVLRDPDTHMAEEFVELVHRYRDRRLDAEARDRLTALKQELRNRLPGNVHEYGVRWTGQGISTDHIAAVCEDVYDSLSRVMVTALERLAEVDAADRETEEHVAFAESRAETMVGRAGVLASIDDYVQSGTGRPLVLVGGPGVGVSTVVAEAFTRARSASDDVTAIARFVGTTPQSTDGTELLRGICVEFARRMQSAETALPMDYLGLAGYFREALDTTPAGRTVAVFVDGLDALQGEARDLRWMPAELASAAALVVSVEPGPLLDMLERMLPADCFVRVESPGLSAAGELLEAWLKKSNRTLQPHQRQSVLDGFSAAGESPLYLRLAFEQAVRWRSFDSPGEAPLPTSTAEMVRDLFWRLSRHHGSVLVSRTLGFLAASLQGLSEPELLDLLSRDEQVVQEQRIRSPHVPVIDRLPLVSWFRLRDELGPYLAERLAAGVPVLIFFHRALAQVAAEDYLAGEEGIRLHRALAEYFGVHALEFLEGERRAPNLRKMSELPYQQTMGELWDDAFALLTDFGFLERKASDVGIVEAPDGRGGVGSRYLGIDLIAEDLARLVERLPHGHPGRTVARSLLESVRRETHVLHRWPDLLWQQLYNRLQWSGDPVQELLGPELHRRLERGGPPWMRVRTPLGESAALVRTLVGHQGPVRACAISDDGTLIVSAGNDSTVKLWDAASGQDRATLAGHGGWVSGCAVDEHGTLLLTASEDLTVRVWNLASGARADRVFAGHEDVVTACALSASGDVAVSSSRDGTLKLWDVEGGHEVMTLGGHEAAVTDCDISRDGGLVLSAGADGQIRLWDARSGRALRTFASQDGRASLKPCCAISSDGGLVVGGHGDGSLRVWDASSAQLLATLDGGEGSANDCAVSSDGSVVAAAFADRTIHIWDTNAQRKLGVLHDPGGPVDTCAVGADGRFVVSGGRDGTLKLWDVGRSTLEAYRTRHAGAVRGCTFNVDGSSVATAGDDATLRVSETETGDELTRIEDFDGPVLGCVALGSSSIVACGSDGALHVWDSVRLEKLVIPAHEGSVLGADAEGSFLVSCGDDGTTRLWRVSEDGTVHPQWRRSGRQGVANACTVAADGTTISAFDDGTLQIWDEDGEERVRLVGHTSSVTSCVLLSHGSRAVSVGWDGTVRIWDALSGDELSRFEAHADRIWDCDLSANGRLIATAGGDRTIRLWDLAGSQLGLLPLPAEVLTVTFHPSRPVLACGDAGGNIHMVELVGLSI